MWKSESGGFGKGSLVRVASHGLGSQCGHRPNFRDCKEDIAVYEWPVSDIPIAGTQQSKGKIQFNKNILSS